MPTNINPPKLKRSSASMPHDMKLLVVIAVLCFGILHIIGGSMLRYAPAAPPVENAIAPTGGD